MAILDQIKSARTVIRCARRQYHYPYAGYMDTHQCIFLHIPKTGGSSVRYALGAPERGRTHLSWTVYQQSNPEKFGRYFKFAFVRNPLDRAYSAYTYLKRGGNGNEDIKASKIIQEYDSFDDFVLRGLAQGKFLNHIMFSPQVSFICDWSGDLKVDFLGCLENFSEDFLKLSEYINVLSDAPHTNSSPAKEKHQFDFSEEADNVLRRIYLLDFLWLHYE